MQPQITDLDRLPTARRMMEEQRQFRDMLGRSAMGDTTLDLILTLFVASAEGETVAVRDLLERVGPSPSVTWRWLMVLVEDRVVVLSSEGRNGAARLTERGLDRIRPAMDISRSYRAETAA